MFNRFLTRTRQRWQSISAIGFAGLLFFAGLSQAAGKPKPPPPPPADPAIAYSVGTPSTGTWGDMMVMNADGSNQTVVVPGGGTRPVSPSWSPDGRSLVYSHLFNGVCSGLHVVAKDQSGNWGTPQPLTTANQCLFGWVPAWSPNNSSGINTVVYSAIPQGQDTEAIFMVKFTHSNGVVTVTEGPTLIYAVSGIHESDPTWSFDGSRIAFVEADNHSESSPNRYNLLVLDPDNPSTPTRLIPDGSPLSSSSFWGLSWAKTKNLLVAAAGDYPRYDLWCINIDDPTQIINLTGHLEQVENLPDVDPSWSTNDSKIIFSRGGVAMALTINTANGCPNSLAVASATLSQVAKAKGKNSLWGFDWRREPQP